MDCLQFCDSVYGYHGGKHGSEQADMEAESPTSVGNRKWSQCRSEGSLSKRDLKTHTYSDTLPLTRNNNKQHLFKLPPHVRYVTENSIHISMIDKFTSHKNGILYS